ncbi:MAG: ParB/RepB/Spo0J family partition protein [Nitrososphaerales archaeon]
MIKRSLDIDLIEPDLFELRGSESGIEELARSFSEVGQLSPVLVRPHPRKKGSFQLIYGYRRYQAAKKLKWRSIKAEVKELGDEDAIKIALTENVQREDLSDYEKAKMMEYIHSKYGKTYEEIACILGKSRQWVTNHVAMLKTFPQTLFTAHSEAEDVLKKLPEHHARILAKVKDLEERFHLAKLTVEEGLCVKELEKLVGRPRSDRSLTVSAESFLRHPDFTKGFIKQRGLILLSGRRLRICLVRMDTLNTLIANLKKPPYEVGRYLGEQAADVLREEFEPHRRRNWRKVMAALNSNSGWGKFSIEYRDGYVVKVERAAIADPEFLRGYLEGCLGVSLVYKETNRQAHIFKIEGF